MALGGAERIRENRVPLRFVLVPLAMSLPYTLSLGPVKTWKTSYNFTRVDLRGFAQ
jgi:hypothetical protein